jgi:hypothetical protein
VDFARDLLADPRNEKVIEAAPSGAADKRGLSSAVILLLVLIWLGAVGLPMVEAGLPTGDQGVLTNELATVGLALAVTWRIIDGQKKH